MINSHESNVCILSVGFFVILSVKIAYFEFHKLNGSLKSTFEEKKDYQFI